MSSLPPELTDHILDFCFDDKPTLFTCSLVSRSFNATCRHHIFSKNIDVSNTPKVKKTARELREKEKEKERREENPGDEQVAEPKSSINPASSAGSFLRIVLAPSSTLAPFLQELSLVLRPASLASWSVIVNGRGGTDAAWLDELLALLPAGETSQSPFHLRSLRIYRHGVDLSSFALTALHKNFSTITTLALFETTLQRRSLKRDMEWICRFEHVEDLLLYGHHRGERTSTQVLTEDGVLDDIEAHSPWGWTRPDSFDLNKAVDAQGTTTIRLPRSVRKLRLDLPGPALEAVMQWLLAHAQPNLSGQEEKDAGSRNIPRVPALHIFRVMEDESPALGAYLRACKDTLEDLMMFLYQRTTNRKDFDFSEHTTLRTLFLASNGSKPMHVLHDILATTRSSQLQKLLLQTPPWQLSTDDDAWEALDKLLSGSKSTTAVLAVVDGCRPGQNYEEEKLRSRFPSSTANNLNIIKSKERIVMGYVDEVYGRMKTF